MRSKFIKRNILILLCIWMGICPGCKENQDEFEEIVIEEQKEPKEQEEKKQEQRQAAEEKAEEEKMAVVFVCGAVENPGVYELPEGSRIRDALEAAGGMKEEAVFDYLNQAAVINDGQQIYVPTPEELEEGESPLKENPQEASGETAGQIGKVNLNKASKEELMTLPGIGEAKADSILRYREENGGFKSIEELMEIEGIKSGVFQKIQDDITVS